MTSAIEKARFHIEESLRLQNTMINNKISDDLAVQAKRELGEALNALNGLGIESSEAVTTYEISAEDKERVDNAYKLLCGIPNAHEHRTMRVRDFKAMLGQWLLDNHEELKEALTILTSLKAVGGNERWLY